MDQAEVDRLQQELLGLYLRMVEITRRDKSLEAHGELVAVIEEMFPRVRQLQALIGVEQTGLLVKRMIDATSPRATGEQRP